MQRPPYLDARSPSRWGRSSFGAVLAVVLSVACSLGAAPLDSHQPAVTPAVEDGQAAAVFGGGCFWCLEADFDKLDGILHTTSGYAGGPQANPTYTEVAMHKTQHVEVVRVVYDTSKLTYDEVLHYFWRHVDPTDAGGQFCDRGDVYRTAVFTLDDTQHTLALASKKGLDASGILPGPVVTEVRRVDTFWPAENYHQDFHVTTPMRYVPYRKGCGRDARVAEVWAKDR